MKTDPQGTDYELEEGATRNFEHWREEEKVRRHIRAVKAYMTGGLKTNDVKNELL